MLLIFRSSQPETSSGVRVAFATMWQFYLSGSVRVGRVDLVERQGNEFLISQFATMATLHEVLEDIVAMPTQFPTREEEIISPVRKDEDDGTKFISLSDAVVVDSGTDDGYRDLFLVNGATHSEGGKHDEMVLEIFPDRVSNIVEMSRAAISTHIQNIVAAAKIPHPRSSRQKRKDRKELMLHARDLRKVFICISCLCLLLPAGPFVH